VTETGRLLLPSLDELERVLTELFDVVVRADRVRVGRSLPLPYLAATYRDASGVLHAVAMVDLVAAVVLGATLSRIPPVVRDEALVKGELTEAMRENLHEVMNVLSLLFNEQRLHALHVRVGEFCAPESDEVRALMQDPATKTVTATLRVGAWPSQGTVWFVVRWG
jgi:hypothetical protein